MEKRPKLKWIKKWKVSSFTDLEKSYTVSLALDGDIPVGLGVKHAKIVNTFLLSKITPQLLMKWLPTI